jgi:hypothetical protein
MKNELDGLDAEALRNIIAEQHALIHHIESDNLALRTHSAELKHRIDELANIPASLSEIPRPVGYVTEDDLARMAADERSDVHITSGVKPLEQRYEPLYTHPQGAELERWIRLAILWQSRLEGVESELFYANYKLAQFFVHGMKPPEIAS